MSETQMQPAKSASDPADNLSGQALAEALIYLKEQWRWSGAEIGGVLHIPTSTINTWFSKKLIPVSKPFSPDAQAILQLVAIHKNLQNMFERSEHQLKWINTKHPDFNETPIEKMKSSIEGLICVRQYLDYVRGRGA